MPTLIEQLIAWQRINAMLDAVGFSVCAVVFLWLFIRIWRLEARIKNARG